MSQKYFIITYGCQMNKSDSERIATVLEDKGYKPTPNENEADLIVVNMCSVRQSAVDRVYGLFPKFQKLKTKKPQLKTILTGCILKEDRRKLKKIFDLILDIKDLPNWPKISVTLSKSWQNKVINYFKIEPKRSTKTSVFIPISNGCNNFCTYCVVPFVRGPLICRNHNEILEEVKNAVKKGFKEIWLLGQNVNDYTSRIISEFEANKKRINSLKLAEDSFKFARNRKINFAKLLIMINGIPRKFKFFFTSPHPKNFSDELINTLASCEKFGKYLNLPVQSGNNKILKKMNRNYTVKEYKNLVKKIRKKIPDINLSTDVIVGFPGETKKQFQNTVKLFKDIGFNMAYIAKYSPRPGTSAFKMKNNVLFVEKKRREKILREIINKKNVKK